ncbi:hypothetical protein N5U28_10400 [Aliarcobacter butzleri]|uniref:hypothetical protein n=1 Tax=Aliarcobacter butzleri TaxID=28197 RepID=UPI000DB25AFC|nr:hypothetical protein [Aliarcobacter butzleri]MCT7595625.1 hypothetical protein [Aliarcobacter butzleri]PZQ07298.1 MAG: hypothetical protein DI567_04250 [Aliarcobacter butzleri]
MEITNKIFETLLTKNDFKKKEFADYSKIPYDTVVGWKKKAYVPAYAMVILKDMIYRKKLDEETEKLFKRNIIQPTTIQNYNLTKIEENKLKAVFWGTNFTTDDILKGIREKNQKILKKIEENLPLNLQKQILGKLNYA